MWKTFAGRCIYQSEGIRVFQNPLFRWLKFDSKAVQTLLNRYKLSRPELRYLRFITLAVQLQPSSCCMLGLGGAGVAHALAPLLGRSKLVVVEASAEIIEVAKRFFWIDSLENMDIIHEEASQFIAKETATYSHLLVDLFTANNFPEQCMTEAFFAHCKQRLEPGGLLAVNSANAAEHFAIFQLMQKQFLGATLVMAVPGTANLILFAQKGPTITPFLQSLKATRKIKQLSWTEHWGYVASLR